MCLYSGNLSSLTDNVIIFNFIFKVCAWTEGERALRSTCREMDNVFHGDIEIYMKYINGGEGRERGKAIKLFV